MDKQVLKMKDRLLKMNDNCGDSFHTLGQDGLSMRHWRYTWKDRLSNKMCTIILHHTKATWEERPCSLQLTVAGPCAGAATGDTRCSEKIRCQITTI